MICVKLMVKRPPRKVVYRGLRVEQDGEKRVVTYWLYFNAFMQKNYMDLMWESMGFITWYTSHDTVYYDSHEMYVQGIFHLCHCETFSSPAAGMTNFIEISESFI